MRAASNRCDLTSGSIWRSLLLFALPLLAGSLVQQLYNTVDLILSGTSSTSPHLQQWVPAVC